MMIDKYKTKQLFKWLKKKISLFNPRNRSTPGLPVHHQLPEFTQTQLHRVGDAIQPSHPLLSPSPPAPNPSQLQSQLFAWGGQSTGVSALASFLPKNTQDWSPLEWTQILNFFQTHLFFFLFGMSFFFLSLYSFVVFYFYSTVYFFQECSDNMATNPVEN